MASHAQDQSRTFHTKVFHHSNFFRDNRTTMHRSYLEIVAASVVYGPHDKTTPIPIIRFQAPEKVLEAYVTQNTHSCHLPILIRVGSVEWPRDIIDDENFTVIHEVTVRKYATQSSYTVTTGLNKIGSMDLVVWTQCLSALVRASHGYTTRKRNGIGSL